jgi:hypothetical protein
MCSGLIKRYQVCKDAAEVQAVQKVIVNELEEDYEKRRTEGLSQLVVLRWLAEFYL